ncbi:MAG: hypothetical protein KME12_20440 [Trichocoleus desertorum ATA4-8-CV12]|jgi:hypothetical protein|nr:hypothetical protein [Trichocoleus desertorum ATA4-8-CV12]
MNFKQTVLNLFPWLKSTTASNLEPLTPESEPNAAPQTPVTMSFYAAMPKTRTIPGRRTPAGSR